MSDRKEGTPNLTCTVCDETAELLCECSLVAYCSKECADADWLLHESVCPASAEDSNEETDVEPVETESAEPSSMVIAAEASTAEQQLRELVVDGAVKASTYNGVFKKLYKINNYPYVVLNYDRTTQRLMPLTTYPDADVAITALSTPQRLGRDFRGPWNRSRGAVLKLPTGFGKTALGHAIGSNYRYEVKSMETPVGLKDQKRILIWVTEKTLVHSVMKDVWAQGERNPESVIQLIEEAGLRSTGALRPSAFSGANVMTYRQFTNMLTGSNRFGRMLWAGFDINESVVLANGRRRNISVEQLPGLNIVPTAYRFVNGEWVRGLAPHNINSTEHLRNLELRFSAVPSRALIEEVAADIVKGGQFFVNLWRETTRRKQRDQLDGLVDVEQLDNRTLLIVLRWKVGDIPSEVEWAAWVRSVANSAETLAAMKQRFDSLEGLGSRRRRLAITFSVARVDEPDASERGWVLRNKGVSRSVFQWAPADSPEDEVDYNPLNRLTIVFDEGHLVFDPKVFRAAERPDAALLTTALRDATECVQVWMSATIDLFNGLGIFNALMPARESDPANPRTLGPAVNIPERLPTFYDKENPSFEEIMETLMELDLVPLKDGQPNPGDRLFNSEPMGRIGALVKGMVSVASVDRMRDLFASFELPDDYIMRIQATEAHERELNELLSTDTALPYRQLMRAVALRRPLENRHRLGSDEYDPEAARELLEGEDPAFPAGVHILNKMRELDVQEHTKYGNVTIRVHLSSVDDDDYGVIADAACMQAVGYQWVRLERQQFTLDKVEQRQYDNIRKQRGSMPQAWRKVRIADEPMRVYSEELAKRYGPESSITDGKNQFIVLSEKLFSQTVGNRALPEDDNAIVDKLLSIVMEEANTRTGYRFPPRVGDLEAAGFVVENSAQRSLRSLLTDKELQLWPGQDAVNEREWEANETIRNLLADEEEAVFFVRAGSGDDFRLVLLENEVRSIGRDGQLYQSEPLAWPGTFNPIQFPDDARRLANMISDAGRLSEQERRDAIDTIFEFINDTENNATGERVRHILIGKDFTTGIDIFGATAGIALEPAPDRTRELQRRGRAIRRGGHAGLPFERWSYKQYTIVLEMRDPPRAEQLLEDTDTGTDTFRKYQQLAISSIDVDPTQQSVAGPTKKDLQRRFLEQFGEDVLPGGESNPAFKYAFRCWRQDQPRSVGLTGSTPLQPYEAVRVLAEDPRITVYRLWGELEIDKWAVDSAHNTVITESNGYSKRTNYALVRSKIADRIEILKEEPERYEKEISGLGEVLNLFLEPNQRGQEWSRYRTRELKDLLRELSTKRDERRLYIETRRNKVDLRAALVPEHFGHTGEAGFLSWLVAEGYAVWAVAFDSVAGPSIDSSVEDFNTAVLRAPARLISQSETDESEEDESAVTVGLAIEQIDLPDEEQRTIENESHRRIMRIARVLELGDIAHLTERHEDSLLYLHSRDKPLARRQFAEANRARRIKKTLVELYKYGVMNWFRAAQLMSYALDGVLIGDGEYPVDRAGRRDLERRDIVRLVSGMLALSTPQGVDFVTRASTKYAGMSTAMKIDLVIAAGDWVRLVSIDSEPRHARSLLQLESALDYYENDLRVSVAQHFNTIYAAIVSSNYSADASLDAFLDNTKDPLVSNDPTMTSFRDYLRKRASAASPREARVATDPALERRELILLVAGVSRETLKTVELADLSDKKQIRLVSRNSDLIKNDDYYPLTLRNQSKGKKQRRARAQHVLNTAAPLVDEQLEIVEQGGTRKKPSRLAENMRGILRKLARVTAPGLPVAPAPVESVRSGFVYNAKNLGFNAEEGMLFLSDDPGERSVNVVFDLKLRGNRKLDVLEGIPYAKVSTQQYGFVRSIGDMFADGFLRYTERAGIAPADRARILDSLDTVLTTQMVEELRRDGDLLEDLLVGKDRETAVRLLDLIGQSQTPVETLRSDAARSLNVSEWDLISKSAQPAFSDSIDAVLWELAANPVYRSAPDTASAAERGRIRYDTLLLLQPLLVSDPNYEEGVERLREAFNMTREQVFKEIASFMSTRQRASSVSIWTRIKNKLQAERNAAQDAIVDVTENNT